MRGRVVDFLHSNYDVLNSIAAFEYNEIEELRWQGQWDSDAGDWVPFVLGEIYNVSGTACSRLECSASR